MELQRLRKELPAGKLLREDEELIDRLRKVGEVIDELPVWPFDADTLRKFLTAYVVPIAAAAFGSSIVRGFLQVALSWVAKK
jgi:hypothetical protein